ncbi:Replication termination factor 2 RING-finger [Trinorchestia longiramus]|nr:Replication termination factor 2 RING-finger [Trinorchestia longiramus]
MGKRQHQSDKMYLTTTEWSQFYGGYKKSSHSGAKASFRRLPLSHCCLSLVPFNHPYIDPQGNVYDLEAILPFLRKFKINPVTGKPLSEKQLIRVTFHRSTGESSSSTSADGSSSTDGGLVVEYHCPVLYKPFTNNTHVVAIKTTGNVFSYEAVEQLNIRASNWKELLTDTPFTREDIITLQDPQHLEKFNIARFYHVKNNVRLVDQDEEKKKQSSSHRLNNVSKDTQDILEHFNNTYKAEEMPGEPDARRPDKFNAAHYSTGAVAASLTSTATSVETQHQPALLEDHVVRYARTKTKGYVSLETNLGSLNLEIYCDTVSKTSDNFMALCLKGYYDGTIFHRCIRHFMIQGGDPTGTGKGGECCWGGAFKDEFRPQYSHKGRGVLSMANSGPDTNKSQFFITFRSCQHLDGKHTIFGRVVGGLETLKAMEAVETDNKDTPITPIVLKAAKVFVNPFKEVDEQLARERAAEEAAAAAEQAELRGAKRKRPQGEEQLKPVRSGVGKFLDFNKVALSSLVPCERNSPPSDLQVRHGATSISSRRLSDL